MKDYLIKKNTYYDSVTLMLISRELSKINGVNHVIAGMATDLNLDLVGNLEMMNPEIEKLGPNDFFIAADFDESRTSIQILRESFTEQINQKKSSLDGDYQPPTLKAALEHLEGANLVQISVPGKYAAMEVEVALEAGLHVMLFSDNVSVDDELRLKKKAVEKGLLMMGPDCGTAIINGVPLCFANAVRRGSIGVVGASGTGTQEVSTQIHKLGEGLSQVIGTGGRDLKEKIGGLMMIQGFQALLDDPETKVILLVSKPPDASVAAKIYEIAKTSPKPVVVDFIGGDPEAARAVNATPCVSLEDAAIKAVAILRGEKPEDFDRFNLSDEEIDALVKQELLKIKPDQKYLRALYTGGTLADEAMKFFGDHIKVYSNIPFTPDVSINNLSGLEGNICLDLGEDQFTQGRPHPMIDPMTRTEFFESHVDDMTAVVLVDVVLGYGSYVDPAGAVAESVRKARQRLEKSGKDLIVIASITGTDQDPQDLDQSTAALKKEGVIVMPSNMQAVRLTDLLMREIEKGG